MKNIKKGIIFIIILAMVMAFVPIEKVQAYRGDYFYISLEDKTFASSAVPGDVNLDGYVTLKDYILIEKYQGYTIDRGIMKEQESINADVNKDTMCNSIDFSHAASLICGNTRETGVNELRNGSSITLYAYNSTTDLNDETKITSSSSVTWSSSDETLATVDTSSNDGSATIIANSNEKTGDVTITATSGDYTDSFVLHIVNSINKVMQTGITLESDNIKKEETKHTVYVTLDSSCMDNGLAGFSARVELLNENYLQGEPTLTCMTEDWEIKAINSSSGVVTFTAEPKEDETLNSIEATTSVKIAIQYDATSSAIAEEAVEIPYSLVITRADIKNNVYNNSYSKLSLYLVKEEESILEVKNGCTDDVKIVENNIYAKLDSSSTTEETIDAEELTDTLNVDTGYTLEIDSTNNTNQKVYTGAKLNINDSSNTTIVQYNIYLIGDICKDSSNVINLADVSYLRKAIVGEDMTQKTDYEQNTTDVNWSNGTPEGPGLGDIGDVIAIRRRILNFVWDDTVPVVTTAPTTAVSQKTKFQDTKSNDQVAVIPQGFKVSNKESDQKIDTGLVVIAPDGSEFVWVPVEDASTMYGTLEDGTKAGKLYNFTDGNVENNTNYNWTETDGVMSWTLSSGVNSLREPDYLSHTTSGDASTNGLNLLSTIVGINGTVGTDNEKMLETWKNQLQNEFNDMIDSVSKNGGFYIGRYETSLKEVNSEKIAQSKKGVTSATGVEESANTWYGLYQKEKEYSSKNSLINVVGSSMIWGSQYDQMMIWMQKNGYNVSSSTPKTGLSCNTGNNGSSIGTTGTVETDKLNNVYDLLGNGFEWTLEARDTLNRVERGGYYYFNSSPVLRNYSHPYSSPNNSSSRLALYIK